MRIFNRDVIFLYQSTNLEVYPLLYIVAKLHTSGSFQLIVLKAI